MFIRIYKCIYTYIYMYVYIYAYFHIQVQQVEPIARQIFSGWKRDALRLSRTS